MTSHAELYQPVPFPVLRCGIGTARVLLPLALRHLVLELRVSPHTHTSLHFQEPPPDTKYKQLKETHILYAIHSEK